MSQSAKKRTEQQEAIERLREWLKPGDTVYTIIRHVSRSGMQREISLKLLRRDGEVPYHLDGNVALALGDRIGKHDGVIVGGCGMDMGFHVVYNLSATLFHDGWKCIGKDCNSSEHQGQYVYGVCTCDDCAVCGGEKVICATCHMCTRCHEHADGCEGCPGDERTWKAGPERDGKTIHKDGGYALKQRWM